MKKKLLFATIILVLLAGVLYYISLPDYLVFNSMSFSNGANRDTELQVIVYQYWNTDEVVYRFGINAFGSPVRLSGMCQLR